MSDHVDAASGFESCFDRAFSKLRTEGLIEGWIDSTHEVPGRRVRKIFGLNGRVERLELVAASWTGRQLEGASEF